MKPPSRWFLRRSSKLDLAATIAAFACSGVLWAASASSLSPELEGRIREALRQQQLALNQASVQVTSETRIAGPLGNQVIETSEEVFFGGPGQIRRDLLKSSSSPASQTDEGPGGWRRDPAARFTRILDSLEPRELLATVDEFQPMERPQAVGAAPSGLQLRIRPKLQRFQIDKAFLWVDPQSGAPLRLEARFGMGLFLRDAQLEVDFKGQADGGPVLPSRMLVHIKTSMPGPRGGGPGGFMEPGGGPGGGEMSIEIRRDYSNYKFGLDLNKQFFSQTQNDQPFRQPGSGRPATERASNADPFEEISLLPNQARPSESQNTSLDEVVFIQGASRQRSGGNNDQREVLRDILGMDR
ncbi:MAG: hypothetical protein WAO20_18420, partial [Acidobacteriota bacterium]